LTAFDNPIPLSLQYVKGAGGASYFPVSAITDRLYARNQLQLMGLVRSDGEGPCDTGDYPLCECSTNWSGFAEDNPTGISNCSNASPGDVH